MLMVRRKVGERIVIGGGIEIYVTGSTSRGVRIGIVAPKGVLVLRGEVHDAITAANAAAAGTSPEVWKGVQPDIRTESTSKESAT